MATSRTRVSLLKSPAMPESMVSLDRSNPIIDAILAAIPFMGILFNMWLGSLTPLIVIGGAAAFILLRFERVPQVFPASWPLLLLPLFCLASAAWSKEPGTTLYYGTLYLATVIAAVLVGAGTRPMSLLKGVFVSFSTYTICSVLFGRWVRWNDGGVAYAGLAGSKNAAGDTAALTILIATLIIVWAFGKRKWMWLMAAIAVMPFGLFSLVYSRATGVLIATMISLPCLLMWIYSRRLERQVRVLLFTVGLLVVGALVATSSIWLQPLFDFILEESGKSTGLTGRALLWRVADDLIARNPWLGTGYNAFWVHGNLDAERLWRAMGITTRKGFNFHNTPRDILVDIGLAGLCLFAVVAVISASRVILRTMLVPTYLGIFCCALIVFQSPRFFFEMLGFSNMQVSTLIVFMALAQAYRADKLNRPGLP